MSKICHKCGVMNADDRVVCSNCGVVLPATAPQQGIPAPTGTYPSQPAAPTSYQPQQPAQAPAPYQPVPVAPQVAKRYGALRAVSTIFNIFAWISLVFGILGGIISGIAINAGYDTGMGVFTIILFILGGIFMGAFSYLMFKVYAEMVRIAIDIEENTRRTADSIAALKK